jgi:hypothetical protein
MELLNDMRAGPSHRVDEMLSYQTHVDKAPAQHVVEEEDGEIV